MCELIKIAGFVQKGVCNFNDGILFEVLSDTLYTCYYTTGTDKKYPLSSSDMVSMEGNFETMIVGLQEKSIFVCEMISARCRSDLTIFLANYFKSSSNSDISEMTMRFTEFADISGDGVSTVIGRLAENCTKNYEKYENDVAICAKMVFPAMEEEKATELMKKFLLMWNSECLIRPLELLGIPRDIINTFRLSLVSAVEICETNPFRIPQIPYTMAERIFTHHFRTEPTRDQTTCGKINRMVLSKLDNNLWTSVPLTFIRNKFGSFDEKLDLLVKEYFCKIDTDSIYLSYILNVENCVTNKIFSLIKKEPREDIPLYYPSDTPSEEQQEAVRGALKENICLIDGGAATGKTTIMAHIIRNAARQNRKPLCVSFTGKAVTRIREIAFQYGIVEMCQIMTIDMAIMMNVDFSMLIIDEISMVTTELFYRFVEKYFKRTDWTLVLIGDVNQLKPISWGSLMKQLLLTGIPRFSLTRNYRSEKSIISICEQLISQERIRNNQLVNWNIAGEDYRFHNGGISRVKDILLYFRNSFMSDCQDLQDCQENEDPEKDFMTKRKSITIVTPFRNVAATLNVIFQEVFMYGDSVTLDYRKWFKSDRVLLLNNNYTINVMNGEEGEVVEIFEDHIIVMFRNDPGTMCPFVTKMTYVKLKKMKKAMNAIISGNTTEYNATDISLYNKLIKQFPLFEGNLDTNNDFYILTENTLAHAYALTVHKSQGSQYINTIFYLPDRNINFIDVNLIYTAISRAEKHLDIIVENSDTLNAGTLRSSAWTSENLALKINSKCKQLENYVAPIIEEYNNEEDGGDNDFDMSDFA